MRKFKVNINGTSYTVEVAEEGVVSVAAPAAAPVTVKAPVAVPPPVAVTAPAVAPAATAAPAEVGAGDTPITAPMPGKVSKIVKKVGDQVAKGECIMILEAMKMQNEIGVPVGGIVKSINVTKGDNVKPGQIMAVVSN